MVKEKHTEGFDEGLEELSKTYTPVRKWTEEQVATVKRYYGRVSLEALARVVKHNPSAIRKKVQELGIRAEKE
jgi:hypothetical protein